MMLSGFRDCYTDGRGRVSETEAVWRRERLSGFSDCLLLPKIIEILPELQRNYQNQKMCHNKP